MASPAWRDDLPAFSDAFRAEFELVDVLGEGGMGRVYLARQLKLDREVAIKVLKTLGDAETARMHREAKVLAGLSHARVLRVFDSGVDAGISYLVMERLEAETLERRLQREPLKLRESLRVCARVADALACAHGQGVVHRDVKPDNVFLLEDLEVKLADFGLARDLDGAQITASGMTMGTPEYMSPEQIGAKAVGPASDQYSLGVMLYRMITHRYPFTGENAITIALARLRTEPTPPRSHCPTLPEVVERAVLRMLAARPQDRYPTAHELTDELERLAGELGPEGDRVYRPGVRSTSRNPVIAAAAGPRRITNRTAVVDAEARAQPGDTTPLEVPRRSGAGAVAGALLVIAGALAALGWRGTARPVGNASASARMPAKSELATLEAGRRLLKTLQALNPAHWLEELARMNRGIRTQNREERTRLLQAQWKEKFAPECERLMIRDAWKLFAPCRDAYMQNREEPARERLALANQIEDLRFLAFGLSKLDLPVPVDDALATEESEGLLRELPAEMDGGVGFAFARHLPARPEPVEPPVRGGAFKPVMLAREAPYFIDDRFHASAIAPGGDTETNLFYEFDRNRPAQVEYDHLQPLVLPSGELQSIAVGVHVAYLKACHRFEIYADVAAKGTLVRLATFRANQHARSYLWCELDPAVLPSRRLYLKVKFNVLPGYRVGADDAELHQVSLHWRRRAASPEEP